MNICSNLEVNSSNPFLKAEFERTKNNPDAYDQEMKTKIIERTNKEAKKIFCIYLAVGLGCISVFAASLIQPFFCLASDTDLSLILVGVGALIGIIALECLVGAVYKRDSRDEQIALLQELFSRSIEMIDSSTQTLEPSESSE